MGHEILKKTSFKHPKKCNRRTKGFYFMKKENPIKIVTVHTWQDARIIPGCLHSFCRNCIEKEISLSNFYLLGVPYMSANITANHATFPIHIYTITVQIFSNLWGTQYLIKVPWQQYDELSTYLNQHLKRNKLSFFV